MVLIAPARFACALRLPVGGGASRVSDSQGVVQQVSPGVAEHVLVGAGAGEVNEDAAHGEVDVCAYLEQLEPDGSAGGFG